MQHPFHLHTIHYIRNAYTINIFMAIRKQTIVIIRLWLQFCTYIRRYTPFIIYFINTHIIHTWQWNYGISCCIKNYSYKYKIYHALIHIYEEHVQTMTIYNNNVCRWFEPHKRTIMRATPNLFFIFPGLNRHLIDDNYLFLSFSTRPLFPPQLKNGI